MGKELKSAQSIRPYDLSSIMPAFFGLLSLVVLFGSNSVLASDEKIAAGLPADPCAATLSSDLKLHVPSIIYGGQFYWADFQYVVEAESFQMTQEGPVADAEPFSHCFSPVLTTDFTLHIPTVIFNNTSYYANLQYSHELFLTLAEAGQPVTYELLPSSTYQEGCVGPCLCPVSIGRGIKGTFALAPLDNNGFLMRYSLTEINWTVTNSSGELAHTITGYGIYQTGGEFARMHQLTLWLTIDGSGPTKFDSGLVPDESQFPNISISVDQGALCFDRRMAIRAAPIGNL